MRLAISIALATAAMLGAALIPPAQAAGDLSQQNPVEVTVDLGMGGKHVFVPNKLRFETGKLYKLIHATRARTRIISPRMLFRS
ncbi:MAG TPA: hypothetical protein VHK44_06035 [Xanthobacteraceae bacterium]|nr:hypothetical protein [Xanthobacteraceae bacterium]